MHAEAHAGGRELGRRPVEDHTLLQHDDPVEVRRDGRQLVRDEQDSGTMCLDEMDERVAEQALLISKRISFDFLGSAL